MTVPYTFATQVGSIPLSQLDSNFASVTTLGTTPFQLGDTVPTIAGLNFSSPVIVGNMLPSVTNTQTLGSASYVWNNVYSTTFTGALTGNVTGNVTGNLSGSVTGSLAGSITATSGTIDTTVIGGTTAAAGTFTNLTANTTLVVNGALSGTGVSNYLSTYLASPPAIGGTTPAAISGTTGTFTGNIQSISQNGGQLAGLRNKITNGNFFVDQRNAGAAQTITAAAALAYTVDRFYAYCTGANVTGQRIAGTAPNAYLYQFTGAASVTKIGFAQRIENLNSQDLAGTTATLSVDLSNSSLTSVTWTAWYANTANTFGTLASPTRTSIATGTFTVTSTLTRYNANITIPSAATTGIEIELSVGAQLATTTWAIGNIQLERGTVATPFEYLPIGATVFLSQRYYEKSFPIGIAPAQNLGLAQSGASRFIAGKAAATAQYGHIKFAVPKRASPTTIVFYNPSAANAQVRNTTVGADLTATTSANASEISFDITATGSTATAVGDALDVAWTADSEL